MYQEHHTLSTAIINNKYDIKPHTQTLGMTIPEGQNWPRVKMKRTDTSWSILPPSLSSSPTLAHMNSHIQQMLDLPLLLIFTSVIRSLCPEIIKTI